MKVEKHVAEEMLKELLTQALRCLLPCPLHPPPLSKRMLCQTYVSFSNYQYIPLRFFGTSPIAQVPNYFNMLGFLELNSDLRVLIFEISEIIQNF